MTWRFAPNWLDPLIKWLAIWMLLFWWLMIPTFLSIWLLPPAFAETIAITRLRPDNPGKE
ncbi:MAG TPA: hypothetical protein EYP31_07865 [Roseibacterium sp.]|nr:hypothetical protein [Roseibacterium sp.]